MKFSIKGLFTKSYGLILLTGFVITLVLFGYILRQERAKEASEFSFHAYEHFSRIVKEIESNLDVSIALQSFFESSQEVTRQEFRRFVKPFLIAHSDIQLVGWVPFVSREQIEGYLQKVHADGFVDFQINERNQDGGMVRAAERREHFPVMYVEPYKGNDELLGFDMGSEQTLRLALEKARDTGEMTIGGRFTLGQEKGNDSSVMVFTPVYRNYFFTNTIEERRVNLGGYIISVINISEMMASLPADLRFKEVHYLIYDHSGLASERVLYQQGLFPSFDGMLLHQEEEVFDPERKFFSRTIQVADREWILNCKINGNRLFKAGSWHAWSILVGCLTLTVVLSAFLRNTSIRTQELRALNKSLYEEIRERKQAERAQMESDRKYRDLIENINDVVFSIDTQGCIIYISPVIESVIGYRPLELIGQTFTDYVYKADLESFNLRFKRSVAGAAKPAEYRIVSKSGKLIWVRDSCKAY